MLTVGKIIANAKDCFAINNIDLSYKQLYYYWREYLFSKSVLLFKWDGLPFKQREIEKPLLLTGYCFVWDKIPYFCTLSNFTGTFFDQPKAVNIYAPTKSNTVDIDRGVLIDNTSTRISIHPLVHRYACELAHNVLTFMQVLICNRNPNGVPVVATNKQKESFDDYIKALKVGEMSQVYDPSYLGIRFVGESKRENDPRTYLEVEQNLLASFYHDIGVKATKGKKGNMLTPEIEGDDTMLLLNLDDMLLCRKEGAEELNKMYGWDVSVKLNPTIADSLLYADSDSYKEVDASDNTADD